MQQELDGRYRLTAHLDEGQYQALNRRQRGRRAGQPLLPVQGVTKGGNGGGTIPCEGEHAPSTGARAHDIPVPIFEAASPASATPRRAPTPVAVDTS